jgi:hypothetical protein
MIRGETMKLTPIPPDPQPTQFEIEEIMRAESLHGETGRDFARFKWRRRRQADDPNAFHIAFSSEIRDRNYDAYTYSPLWNRIKRKIFKAANNKCFRCLERAKVVHHRDYRPRVLNGDDLTPLVALCKRCHDDVHYPDVTNKWKTRSWAESEEILSRPRVVTVPN